VQIGSELPERHDVDPTMAVTRLLLSAARISASRRDRSITAATAPPRRRIPFVRVG
jgi:hypothetical protein